MPLWAMGLSPIMAGTLLVLKVFTGTGGAGGNEDAHHAKAPEIVARSGGDGTVAVDGRAERVDAREY